MAFTWEHFHSKCLKLLLCVMSLNITLLKLLPWVSELKGALISPSWANHWVSIVGNLWVQHTVLSTVDLRANDLLYSDKLVFILAISCLQYHRHSPLAYLLQDRRGSGTEHKHGLLEWKRLNYENFSWNIIAQGLIYGLSALVQIMA